FLFNRFLFGVSYAYYKFAAIGVCEGNRQLLDLTGGNVARFLIEEVGFFSTDEDQRLLPRYIAYIHLNWCTVFNVMSSYRL
ncbi:MAG: hypothetical protein WA791_06060, partial [Rhodomicrobium sp.]